MRKTRLSSFVRGQHAKRLAFLSVRQVRSTSSGPREACRCSRERQPQSKLKSPPFSFFSNWPGRCLQTTLWARREHHAQLGNEYDRSPALLPYPIGVRDLSDDRLFCQLGAMSRMIAKSHAHARFSSDSPPSPETLEIGCWSEQDLNFQPRFSSAKRIAQFPPNLDCLPGSGLEILCPLLEADEVRRELGELPYSWITASASLGRFRWTYR